LERLAREIQILIESRINELKDNIVSGFINDIAEYKKQTGQIEGLRAALELVDDAARKLHAQ
jgi:hypothetical protein